MLTKARKKNKYQKKGKRHTIKGKTLNKFRETIINSNNKKLLNKS